MANKIFSNTLVRIEAQVRTRDGTLVNPIGVRCYLIEPDGTDHTFVYGTDEELERDETGIYYVDWNADQVGRYKYTFETYGDIIASFKSFFEVENSRW